MTITMQFDLFCPSEEQNTNTQNTLQSNFINGMLCVFGSHHDRNNDDDKMTTAQQGVHDVYGANVQWTSELSAPVELNRINGHLAAMKSAYERIERSKNPMAR